MSDQIAIPVDVPLPEIERKKSLGQALVMCMKLDWLASIRRFNDALGVHVVLDAADIARGYYPYGGKKAFLYFCGICWNRIRAKREEGAA